MKKNGHWITILRDKVDSAQVPSAADDGEGFDRLLARMAAAPSRGTSPVRRWIGVAAAAAAVVGALLLFRPAVVPDRESVLTRSTAPAAEPEETAPTSADTVGLSTSIAPSSLLAEAASAATDGKSAVSHTRTKVTARPQPSTAGASTAEAETAAADDPSSSAVSVPSADGQPVADAAADDLSAESPSKQPAVTSPSHTPAPAHTPDLHLGTAGRDMELAASWTLAIASGMGERGTSTILPTFAHPAIGTASAEGTSYMAPSVHQRTARPELASKLTAYDYDACTFIHYTPYRLKATALCHVVYPYDDVVDLSVGTGLMYTEMNSTVIPPFKNEQYSQRLRFVGVPVELDAAHAFDMHIGCFLTAGLSAEYCFQATLDGERQPEKLFHLGAFEQVGLTIGVSRSLSLGLAAEWTQHMTRTVLHTPCDGGTTFGMCLSLRYLIW